MEAHPSEFSFVLRDAWGHVVSTAVNAADGSVAFPEIEYDGVTAGLESDTYTYEIAEASGEEDGIDYDETVATVTVRVTRADGGLEAKVTYSKPKRYGISYDLAGGAADGLPDHYFSGSSDETAVPDPTRSGYTFKGWTGTLGDEPVKGLTIPSSTNGKVELVANWEEAA